MSANYQLSGPEPIDPHRIEQFFDGKLSINELVILAQDAIDSGGFVKYGPHLYYLVLHCSTQGLCRATGMYLQ